MARAESPEQAGYTNATALTTSAKEKLCSLLVGRVHIRLVRLVSLLKIGKFTEFYSSRDV
jgi:hypothetical protein